MIILIIPLIIFIASFLFRLASGPFWQYGDPCFNYYFNAILIIKNHTPVDITHPGTPLQILIALVIRILNIGHSTSETVNQALLNPEFYLGAVYALLILGCFLTSVMLGAYIYHQTKDKLAVWLGQLVGFSFIILPSFDAGSYPVLPVIANVSAEPVFIIVMNLFNLFLLGLYFSKEKSQEIRNIILLALVCGLGLATKINFLIILLSALMLVPLRRKLLFMIVCMFSFIGCTWPIISKYGQLFHWISDMVGHSSRYGTGSEKFIDWNSFFFYLHLMMRVDWFFILSALILWIWSSIYLVNNRQDRTLRFIWALTFCCLLQIAATAKHFSFHYLLPAFALFNSIFLLFYLNQKDRHRLLKPLTVAFVVLFVGICVFDAVPYYQKLMDLTTDIRQFNQKIKAKYPNCSIIPASSGDVDVFLNQEMVLQRANGTNYRIESDDLSHLYPHSYYFFSEEVTSPDPSVESYGIWGFKHRVWGDDIIATCPCAIFIKYGSDFSSYPYQVRLLDQSKYLSASLLVNSSEKEANELFSQAMEASQNGDYQKALMLGLKSRQLNYEPRGQLEYILTIIYQELMKSQSIPSNPRP